MHLFLQILHDRESLYTKYQQGSGVRDDLIQHLGNFIKFLMKLGVAHQIQHLAIIFSKERYDSHNVIQSADVTCIHLY